MKIDDIDRELTALLRDLRADRIDLAEAQVRTTILTACVRLVELRARLFDAQQFNGN